MKGITRVLFDFGGVLVNLDKQRCLQAFTNIGLRVDSFISKYTQSGIFLGLERGELSADDFRGAIKEMSSHDVSDEAIDFAWNSFLLDIPHYKLDLLLALRKQYRVLMLSNTNAIHFEQVALREFAKNGLSIDNYFDHCYLSYQLGLAKPDKAIFDYVLEKEQVPASEILFLDDGVQNIEMAQELGFQTYLVKENEDFSSIFKPITAR